MIKNALFNILLASTVPNISYLKLKTTIQTKLQKSTCTAVDPVVCEYESNGEGQVEVRLVKMERVLHTGQDLEQVEHPGQEQERELRGLN